jgi:hypothetical protein
MDGKLAGTAGQFENKSLSRQLVFQHVQDGAAIARRRRRLQPIAVVRVSLRHGTASIIRRHGFPLVRFG